MLNTIKKDAIFFKKKLNDTSKNMSMYNYIYALLSPEFKLILNYRLYNYLYRKGFVVIATLYYLRCKKKYSSDIHPACQLGVPTKLGHHMGIVIGPDVIIGNYNYIMNSVTIGNKRVGGTDKMPKIGDYNIIGTGSKVLGEIIIGDRNIIGANSVVINDITNDNVVVGAPARVIK